MKTGRCVQAVGCGPVGRRLWFSDVSALEAEDRRTTGLTAGLTAYATMRYINRRSLPSFFTFISTHFHLPTKGRPDWVDLHDWLHRDGLSIRRRSPIQIVATWCRKPWPLHYQANILVLVIKGWRSRHLYTATYRETLTSSGLQLEVAYWLAMTLGGTVQLTSAHTRMNALWTPQSAAITDPPILQPATLWPSARNVVRQWLTIFSSEYYQILIATHTNSWAAVFVAVTVTVFMAVFQYLQHNKAIRHPYRHR